MKSIDLTEPEYDSSHYIGIMSHIAIIYVDSSSENNIQICHFMNEEDADQFDYYERMQETLINLCIILYGIIGVIMEGTHTSERLEGTKNVPDTSSLWHQEYNRTENQATEMKQECTSNKMGETNMITGTGTNTEQNNGAAGTLETNTFKTEAGNKNIPAAGNLNQKEQHSCGKEDSPEKEQLTNKAENDYIAPKTWKPLF